MRRFANDGRRFLVPFPPPSEAPLSGVTSRLWLEDLGGVARLGMLILLKPLLSGGENDRSRDDSSRKLCETADLANGMCWGEVEI